MPKPRQFLLTPMLVVLAAGQALSADFDEFFAARHGQARCYERIYSKAHLESHPDQQITHMTLEIYTTTEGRVEPSANNFEVGLSVRHRGSEEWYGGSGYCSAKANGFHCYLEGDFGRFDLTPLKGSEVKMESDNFGFEGSDFFTIESGRYTIDGNGNSRSGKSDDSVFILAPAPLANCQATVGPVE